MILDDFYNLDNKVIKNDFVIKKHNLLIWPLIRWDVLFKINQLKFSELISHAKQPKISIRTFKYFFYTILYAPHKYNRKFNIIFYVPARGRIGHKNFNIYSDYYSNLTKKTLVIDKSYRGVYHIPKKIKGFATGDYCRLKSYIFSQIKNTIFKKQNSDIEQFIKFIKRNTSFEKKICSKIRKKLYEFYFSYDYYKSYYSNLFEKINPNIIFVNAASYGNYNAMLIKTAKEHGILTGELQHGTISKGHLAYNYGKEVFRSEEYKKYLPDYVLTFGDYWNKQMDIPSKTITIGAPHFYESIKKYKNVKEKKKTILIVSQGDLTNQFVKISEYLSEQMPSYKIIFKLHPGEVPFKDRYKELYKYKNIHIAKAGDIYRFIAESENIVACYSTTVFEAMGFDKNIFILDNKLSRKHIPKDVCSRFKENEELKDLIRNDEEQSKNFNLAYYFNPDWEKNYKRFLEEKLNMQ